MDEKFKIIVSLLGSERVKLGEKLFHHTYTKLNSEAEGFYIATNQRELVEVLNLVYELKIPFFVIGSGTKFLTKKKIIRGLVIKNRTSSIKIGAIKGKVSLSGIGIEEAQVEVDSGVSVNRLNEFLNEQNLKLLQGISSSLSTIGGAIFIDSNLQYLSQQIKVWDKGDIETIDILSLDRKKHVILSVVFKVKARN